MASWIPLYREITRRVLDHEHDQETLLAVLRRLGAAGHRVISLRDTDAAGHEISLAEIDPFTFLASFNRSTNQDNRLAMLAALKADWQLVSDLPTDFEGVPLVNPRNSWWFRYAAVRLPEDIPKLWRLAHAAFHGTRATIDRRLVDDAIAIHGIGLGMVTMGMFWVNPNEFLTADQTMRAFAERAGVPRPEDTGDSYFAWMEAVTSRLDANFVALSERAWQATQTVPTSIVAERPPPLKTEDRPSVWTIAAGRGGEVWESDFLANHVIAIGWRELGDLRDYRNREEIRARLQSFPEARGSYVNDSLACWQFVHEMKPGDFVIAKQGLQRVLAVGRVVGVSEYSTTYAAYPNRRAVEWLAIGPWQLPSNDKLAVKTLTDVTRYAEFVDRIFKTAGLPPLTAQDTSSSTVHEGPTADISTVRAYTIADAQGDLFTPPVELDKMLSRLRRKKNLILQGPPGVGKTFAARRLAYALMEEEDHTRVPMVQFHQSYSYEDFVQGYRPTPDGGFERRNGVFYEFARRAQHDPERDYVFIIDEINRGNLSKVFGELMLLLEADKRGEKFGVTLAYANASDERFWLPENLHLIGTMNTADRSLALLDYALRRRFAFHELRPQFDSPAFHEALRRAGAEETLIERLQRGIREVNLEISAASDLGRGFCLGHSFFCPAEGSEANEDWLRDTLESEIVPLLEEYWFDQPEKARELVRRHFA